jgi:DNA-binding NarL/FixJ family response regulator
MIKIIVADPQRTLIHRLKVLVEDESLLSIISAAQNEIELFHQLQEKQPDLILFDTTVFAENNLQPILKIKNLYPSVKLLSFTSDIDQILIKKMLNLGIDGSILKDLSKDELLKAITTIVRGNHYFDQRISNSILQSHHTNPTSDAPLLTIREKEIAKLIANGMNTQEVAQELFISPLTVETHRKNIFAKLGINKIAQLVRYAFKEGLIK